jgi:hypothetical protein
MQRWESNAPRYGGGQGGHYESYFVRANHPSQPCAFWLRYTVFSPAGRPRDAVGEVWAVAFDGNSGRHVAVKTAVPIAQATFVSLPGGPLTVRVAGAELVDEPASRTGALTGSLTGHGNTVRWDLRYAGGQPPVTLLPERLYSSGFPKAKALVPVPLANFTGHLDVNGWRTEVVGWPGSQNHNWGTRHTEEYAWGQVAGFDSAPETFLECSTARIKLAGLPLPRLTPLVLRHNGTEIRLNAIMTSARATARYTGAGPEFSWTFRSHGRTGGRPVEVTGEITAPREAFVALLYDNPPGGRKTCLNTKIGRCRLRIRDGDADPVELHSANRAAFEILTSRTDHGVPPLLD